jgi:alpha-beta hydrolase superfamily lysophospholipase
MEELDKASIEREDVWFDSSDGKSRIHGYIWWPKGMGPDAAAEDPWAAVVKPRAVVQIVHGMAEHTGRYGDFARFLACHGIVACGHDHICHGGSSSRDRWGKLPLKDGKEILIKDVGRMRGVIHDKLPEGRPHFIFGHSLGSFVTRAYIAREGKGLAGAIICGTGFMPPRTSAMGNQVARTIARLRGNSYRSNGIHPAGNRGGQFFSGGCPYRYADGGYHG